MARLDVHAQEFGYSSCNMFNYFTSMPGSTMLLLGVYDRGTMTMTMTALGDECSRVVGAFL